MKFNFHLKTYSQPISVLHVAYMTFQFKLKAYAWNQIAHFKLFFVCNVRSQVSKYRQLFPKRQKQIKFLPLLVSKYFWSCFKINCKLSFKMGLSLYRLWDVKWMHSITDAQETCVITGRATQTSKIVNRKPADGLPIKRNIYYNLYELLQTL